MPAAQNSWGDPVDDATGPLDAAGNSFDLGPENPREILGLSADEIRPDAIISAARRRLDAVRDACGSEDGVKAAVVSLIVAARQTLLRQAGHDSKSGQAPHAGQAIHTGQADDDTA
jgi:hypothetical protein